MIAASDKNTFLASYLRKIAMLFKCFGKSFNSSLEELNESETRFRIFMNAHTDLTFIKDEHFRYLFANEQTARFFNRTIDEIIGKTDEELAVKSQILPCQSSDKRALESQEQFTIEEQLGDRIFEVTKVPLQLSNNKKGIGGIMKDITERKIQEAKLLESEKKYRDLINLTQEGIWVIDKNSITSFVNPSMAKILGYGEAEMIGKSLFDFMDDAGIKIANENIERRKSGLKEQHDFEFICKNGNRIFCTMATSPIIDESGNYQGAIAGVIDITERKQAEDKIRAIEKNLKHTFDLSPSIIAKVNLNTGYFIEVNKAVTAMLGYTVEEFTSKPFLEFVHPDVRLKTINKVSEKLTLNQVSNFENCYVCKDGTSKWIAWNSTKVDKNGILTAIGSDITERIQSQLKLNQSTKLLEASQAIAKLGGWELDIETNKLFWTAETYRIHETSPEVFNPTVDAGVGYFLPESRRIISEALKLAIEEGKGYDLVLETYTTKGRRIDVRTTCEVTVYHGKPVKLTGIFQDITDQKEIELELAKSEAKQSEMISNISDVIAIINPLGIITYKSPNIKNLFGWNHEELIGKSGFTNVHEDNMECIQKVFADLIEDKIAKTAIEFKYKCKDGTYKMVHCTASNLMSNPRINGILLNYHDISQQTESERLLKESEKRFKALHNASFGGIAIHDNGIIKDCNQGLSDITGYTFEELIGMDGLLCIAEDSREIVKENIKAFYEKDYEVVGLRKNGEEYPLRLEGKTIPFEGKNMRIVEFRDITEQKEGEEKIRAVEKNLKNTFDISPSIICKANVETGYFIEANQAVTRILGYTLEEFIAIPFEDFIHPDDKQRTVDEILGQQNGLTTTSFQNRYLCKDNSYKWMAWHVTKADENGIVTAIASDISERKIIEQQIIETKQFYENIIEGVQDGIWVTDKNDVLFYTNLAMEKIAGVPKEQIIGNNILKDFPEEAIGEFSKFYIQAKQEMKPIWYEINTKTLSRKNVSQNGWLIPQYQNDVFNGVICTVRDVTQRKEAESVVRKLSTAVQQSPSTIIIASLGGIIDYVNPKFTELTGYESAEIVGQKLSVLKSGEQDETFYKEMWETINAGEVWRGQFHNKKKNGELFWEAAAISAILNESGDVINYIKIGEDITQQKNTEAELKIALEKALESDRLKSAFLSNMSHEIRTPMNGILGFINLLNEPNLSQSQISTYSAIINKSGERLLNTINDIIDISKIEAGEVVVSKVETCVNTEIEELYAFFLPEANRKGLSLFVEPLNVTEKLTIFTDSHKLHGVLTNLIKNAIKFTEKGTITFGYELKEDFIEFFVEDTGFGIPKNRIHAIFNRFEQADIEDVRVLEGSGLGLAISKAYVTMLGGEITVESIEGEGSKFSFTIPYLQKEIKENKKMPKPVKNNTSRMENLNLLVVEDDEVSSELLEMLLIDTFPKITFTQNGKDAVEICRNNPEIDLVLMDLKMPVMDGYTATQQIRAFNKDLIIIAQTAYAMQGDREKAIQCGCNDYITKPINKTLLLEIIENLLDS